MGQVSTVGENAALEPFFGPLQKNVLNRQSWATRDELRLAMVVWNERTYHRWRRYASPGSLTPVKYEAIMN